MCDMLNEPTQILQYHIPEFEKQQYYNIRVWKCTSVTALVQH